MPRKLSLLILVILLAPLLGVTTPGIAGSSSGQVPEPHSMTPDNTVILASAADARFSRDFSALLKRLRVEWVVLDGTHVPDSIQDKNLVLLGHPDAELSGELIQGMLTADEIEMLRAATDHHVILEIESPWMEDRTVTICSGADGILRRNAAEEAIRALIAAAPPASDWVQSAYDAERDESLRDSVAQLLYAWNDLELSIQDLTMDVNVNPRGSITSQQAAEDTERLFYLLSHGYAGYAFFNQEGAFERAEASILAELPSQSSWSSDAFSALLHEHLDFIIDCHMSIGDHRFCEHSDFWYDTQLELMLGDGGFQFADDGEPYTLVSVNDADPSSYIFPSINRQGDPIYRLGMLSAAEPPPLLLAAEGEAGERQLEIELQRSDFDYFSEDIFHEDTLGGIPVLRVRSFGDSYGDELSRFAQTGIQQRGEAVVIVDLRGNGGGNESWPVSWIQRLTGERAESVFIFAELESKTSMMGRANAFSYWDHQVSDPNLFGPDADRFTNIAAFFESGASQPRWTGPRYPALPLIPNDTTVIVVTNNLVASAGEGMVMRISQAENVVVVGENTMGALTFGNVSTHKLPHSGLMIWISINLNLFLDQDFREQVGLSPDLWVPAADAVNYAVAALRQGTITTAKPLSQATLDQDFRPESPWTRMMGNLARSVPVMLLFAAGCSIWAYFTRRKPRMLISMGALWILFGGLWLSISSSNPPGFGLMLGGIICLVWGICSLWATRRPRLGQDPSP